MLVFRYWESGNDVVVRVAEKTGPNKYMLCGSFTMDLESWNEFVGKFCQCDGKTVDEHFDKVPVALGL